jgi:7-keto-8-aminopelargonate synthetase-like enzyme
MLTFWQIHRGAGYPALMFKNQAQLIREEAVKVEALIARFTPDEQARIRISPNPEISEDTAKRLTDLFTENTPDTIPDDWKDE